MGSLSRLDKKNLRECRMCNWSFSKDKTQCPKCRAMNIDEIVHYDPAKDNTVLLTDSKDREPTPRISTGPWDINWGKSKNAKGQFQMGIARSSVSLIGGAPGAGKSTLCLQLASGIAQADKREVLYIAGEEGEDDIDDRAKRLGITFEVRKLIRVCPMGKEINLNAVLEGRMPAAIFVDSLPTIMPDPGEAVDFATKLKHWSTIKKVPTIIVDHVTKEEDFAGQMALQHAVDGTFLFTVDDDEVRIFKTIKNRNGPSGVTTLLAMTETGLELYIDDDDDEDDS